VNVPVWRASTHLYENVAELEAGKGRNEDGRFFYGRRGSPTQWSLADALTEMEPGAHGTMLYPSGVAAIACALLSVLKAGDVLLMTDNVYDPSRSLADGFLKRFGVETRYFDPRTTDYDALFCDRTRAILLESPGSLTFEMQDIPAICAAAKKRNVVTLLDNTWATSYFHTALDKGIDMAILSCTKYIVGHSDVMMGSVTTHDKLWTKLRHTAQQLGQTVSPDDAYLASRGLRTLSVRMKAHETSAFHIANGCRRRPMSRPFTIPLCSIAPDTTFGNATLPVHRDCFHSSTPATRLPQRPSSTRCNCSALAIAGADLKALPCPCSPRNTGQSWHGISPAH